MKKIIILMFYMIVLSSIVFAAWTHDKPMIYYTFDNVWTDSGNASLGYTLAPQGGVGFITDSAVGTHAVNFSETTADYANYSNMDGDNVVTTIRTTVFWIKPDAYVPDDDAVVITNAALSNYYQYYWQGSIDTNIFGSELFTNVNFATVTPTGKWSHIVLVTGSGGVRVYRNGTNEGSNAEQGNLTSSYYNLRLGSGRGAQSFDGTIDNLAFFNYEFTDQMVNDSYNGGAGVDYISAGDTTPPTISNLNCTSCNVPYGDTVEPYETEDTTPTFNFTTNEPAWCAIGVSDVNYTTMGASRNCTSGEGTNGHICTLTVQDRFNSVGVNYLYISCKDSSDNEGNASDPSKSNSGPVRMEILGAGETSGDDAIELGITRSEIGGTATIYSSQRVSARDLVNNQFTGIFDRVAVNGDKRWAFNYVSSGESQITGLFNLTPVLYVLQLQNQTNETITDEVGKLINSTWP